MKKMYKAMALVLCAALLVAGSIFGTLAYLQDKTDTVTNTFTTGKVKITLHEFEIDNATGKKVVAGTDDQGNAIYEKADVTGIEDIKLVPRREIEKNPVITVEKGSEECYLFVMVEDSMTAYVTINWDTDLWKKVEGTDNIYYCTNKVNATNAAVPVDVFESVTCKDVVEYKEGTVGTIKITAYAVQAYGFDDAKDAWSKTFGKSTNG